MLPLSSPLLLSLPLQDQYVSVEELVQAMAEDSRFGEGLMRQNGLAKDKLEQVRE